MPREVAIDESAATDFREDVRRMMAEPMVKDGSNRAITVRDIATVFG